MVCLCPWSGVSSLYRIPPSGIRRSKHITPVLISLHWLRVPEHISFKLSVLTYRAIHGAGPWYIQSCFTRVANIPLRRRLCSSCSDRLHILLARLSTVGSRTFPVSGAAVWNDLPAQVTSAPSLAVFRHFCSCTLILTMLFDHKLSVFHTRMDLAITVFFRPSSMTMMMHQRFKLNLYGNSIDMLPSNGKAKLDRPTFNVIV